uniref:G-protein coupled receptors family 1 profile domain-containing protein n=1 Tax=Romanomermis culicivorax TaxID=13658 RepID=A0A915IUX1_ROMCU
MEWNAIATKNWPPSYFLSRRSYGLSVLLLQFGLPVAISCFCYLRISHRLARHIKLRQSQTILPEAERRLVARRRRTNKMMSSMVALFVVAWLPLNAANLVRDFELDFITQGNTYNVIFASCHLASMTSLVWNPVIYGFYSETFRAAVKSIFEPCCNHAINNNNRSAKTESIPLNGQKASCLT